jgi:hypothetical protein
MVCLLRRLSVYFITFVLSSVPSWAGEAEIWSADLTPGWLDENVSAKRRGSRPRVSYSLKRTRVWANGITADPAQGFRPDAVGHSLGAKLQLLRDYNVLVGTELVRGGGFHGALWSNATWEAFVTRDWESLGGVTFSLSTGGLVDGASRGYTQSVSSTLGVPLDLALHSWSTELRLSPSLNLDAASGDYSASLMSEVMGQTQLGRPTDRLKSVLNVTLGYGLAPSARPVASARVELRITPNL